MDKNTKKCLKYLEGNGKITIFAPDNLVLVYKNHIQCKRLHDDVLHISKKPLRGELSGFLSICQAEASCISLKVY